MRASEFDPIAFEAFNRQMLKAGVVLLMVFAVLVVRLWFLQMTQGSAYRTLSENNRIRLYDIPAFRGMIFDRHGELMVDNRPSYDLFVIPEEIQDRSELSMRLKDLVSLEKEQILQKLEGPSRNYPFIPICLKRDISRDELAVIETHRFDLPGVIIEVRPQRYYPYEGLACHVLGYVGEISDEQLKSGDYPVCKPGDLIGKSGVEAKWQQGLNGVPGGEQTEVDALGRRLRVISRKSPVAGANVGLSVDKGLQHLAERLLEEKRGAIVALNPQNGEVLALASSPSFDPNLFVRRIDRETWNRIVLSADHPLQNRAVAGQYPPGSTFKIILALAGLEEGILNPEEEVSCDGAFTFGNRDYRCWRKHGHGRVNLHRAIVESCDVYFYKLGLRLGVDRIAAYAKRLGLGGPTGLDIGQDKEGLIPSKSWKLKRFGVPWQDGETVSVSIGQSFVLVTPIQMATMISAVFNGGLVYRPQVTRWVGKSGGPEIYRFAPSLAGKAGIQERHLELVKKALIGVVHDARGTGSKARLKETLVAGKTGTAQVIGLTKDPLGDRMIPVHHKDHAWFVAVAPAEKPTIAVSVVIEHGGHGGSAAAPVSKEIIQSYLGVTE